MTPTSFPTPDIVAQNIRSVFVHPSRNTAQLHPILQECDTFAHPIIRWFLVVDNLRGSSGVGVWVRVVSRGSLDSRKGKAERDSVVSLARAMVPCRIGPGGCKLCASNHSQTTESGARGAMASSVPLGTNLAVIPYGAVTVFVLFGTTLAVKS